MLKSLENRLRGWVPKEMTLSARQQPAAHRFFPTHRAIVAYAVLIAGAALAGALLGALGSVLGIYSKIGWYWDLATSMAIAIAGALLFGKKYRREQQKEAKLREL
jgi:membrane protein implicated in regulation of membrane protease activity